MKTTDEAVVDPPFWSKTSWIQIGYSLWVNQVVVLIGLTFGFSAVAMPQLRQNTPFSATTDEMSWIVSVLLLTAPIGCLISGFTMDKIGRRLMLVFCLLPMIVGWFYTGLSTSAFHMIVGRIITGIGVGLCAGVPRTFSTEITLPNIRGVVGIIPTLAIGIGITVEGFLGSLWSWKTLCFISGIYSAILMVLNAWLPETPYFVLMSGDMKKTMESLKRIRAKEYNTDREMEEMRHFQLYNNIRKLPTKEMVLEIFKPHACKPFSIIMGYIFIGQMAGISIMMFWTVDILKASRSSLDPYVGNVILGVTRLFSTIGTSVLVFWVRRRPLAIGSALGIGILLISFGLFLHAKLPPSIVPQIVYILYMAMASLGYYSLPLMMLYELLPLQIRGFLGGITVALVFISMFLANKVFPGIRNALGFPGTIILFGVSSLIGFVFLYFCLPETKDLTLQDIEEFYRGRRPTLRRESMTIRPAPSILKLQEKDNAKKRLSKVQQKDSEMQEKENAKKRPSKVQQKDPELKRQPSVTFNVNNRRSIPGIDDDEPSKEPSKDSTEQQNTKETKQK